MKHTYSLKAIAVGSALALSSFSAFAQSTDRTAPAATASAEIPMAREHDRANYSWIGLLGLLGLAGLLRKRDDDHARVATGVRHA